MGSRVRVPSGPQKQKKASPIGGAFFMAGQPDQPDQPDQPGQTNPPDQPDQPGQLGLPDQPNQLDQVGSAVQKLTAHVFVEAKVKPVVTHQFIVCENLFCRAAGCNGSIVKNAHPVATGYQGKD